MFLIERYIISEVRRPFLTMVGVLAFIFAMYSSKRYLAESTNGTMALGVVMDLVYYRVLVALEMLIPVALYVSAVLSLGRLYNDSEMTAISASGISPARIYLAVAILAIPISIAVSLLSMYGRPWAYDSAYQLERMAKTELDVTHLQPERFNINQENGRMILAQHIDYSNGHLHDVLIYDVGNRKSHLLRSEEAWIADPTPSDPILEMRAGDAYALHYHETEDQTTRFSEMKMHFSPIELKDNYKRKAASNAELKATGKLSDLAELQWRQSRGISTLLLALLAVPLSKTAPRRGRFAKMLPVTLVYAVIFYAGSICKDMVGNNALPLMPGMWIIPLIMGLAILILLKRDIGSSRIRLA
ncbi:LPS export ABC transporter permease LptF [Azomonas macrocytogenes]|uniref:Lipopolysaccharide export system permease protein LptF n=1 Tax=Azomonas macrocytogenes TaxID=69962 RepID=A0A839T857_AZOMA|nr:LPS export ABC transporter permease LptF [Azomonas macrocytogenes]MBB3104434.1 lipopolysaccharide export system permease protein [Azomonas macrocytogenes]